MTLDEKHAAGASANFEFLDLDSEIRPHVLAIRHNAKGDLLAASFSDHRIRVYSKSDDRSQEWTMIKWICCRQGDFLASTGFDNQFKLWAAASSHAKGRRYRRIFAQSPSNHVPYPAFDWFSVGDDVNLVLISNTGSCTVLEPTDVEQLRTWKEIDAFYPFGQLHSSVGPHFGLSCNRARPLEPSDDHRQQGGYFVTLAISYHDVVKIFHSEKTDEDTHAFHEVSEVNVKKAYVKNILFAPPGSHSFDLLLGVLLQTGNLVLYSATLKWSAKTIRDSQLGFRTRPSMRDSVSRRTPAASEMTTGLMSSTEKGMSKPLSGQSSIAYEIHKVAKLILENAVPIVQISWDMRADLLITTGLDRGVYFWKRDLNGEWVEFAELSQQEIDAHDRTMPDLPVT